MTKLEKLGANRDSEWHILLMSDVKCKKEECAQLIQSRDRLSQFWDSCSQPREQLSQSRVQQSRQ